MPYCILILISTANISIEINPTTEAPLEEQTTIAEIGKLT